MQQPQQEPGDIVPPDVDELDEEVSTGSSHSTNFVDDGSYDSPTPPPVDVKPKKQRRVRVASCKFQSLCVEWGELSDLRN